LDEELKIIRKPEIFAKVQLSDPTIWRMEKQGKFPKRIQLGGNNVGWFSHEVNAWLETKSAERVKEKGESKLFKKKPED
jgi:prophage regulatory protein